MELPMAKAINAGLRAAMLADDAVMLMGEDIAQLGGVFRVTEGLQEQFGPSRVLDTPLAEAGIVGTAIGLAMRGYKPVCEIQFDGFVYPAFDQIVTQLAKLTSRHAGTQSFPVVIRIPYGGHIGAIEHHQESPEAYFAHTAGLRVISPATPHDAYWMIQDAISSSDPVIFLEPKSRYWHKGPVDDEQAGATMTQARIARSGTDVTLIGHGAAVSMMHQAAEIAEGEGISIEIVDLRSLSPLDMDTVLESVRRTTRAVVVQEAPGNVSLGSEVAAALAEKAFYVMQAPVLRVSGFNTPFPPAGLETVFLPDTDRILDAVDRSLAY
ncbi:MAG: transketolase C-terminal domain-containing protein [Microbacteriaceae bacterium]|jgi:2-oxoisovalerate dehydrogenase E1 component beta subunit